VNCLYYYFVLQTLSSLFLYLIQPISLAISGHLGRTQLASVAMAISVTAHAHCINLIYGVDIENFHFNNLQLQAVV